MGGALQGGDPSRRWPFEEVASMEVASKEVAFMEVVSKEVAPKEVPL